MISVAEAYKIVLDQHVAPKIIRLPLMQAVGYVSAEPIFADRPLPPFDRVTMDGIAIDYKVFSAGRKTYHISGVAAAGSPAISLADNSKCLEVMTGAVLPRGVDTVIRYEDLLIQGGEATIQIEDIKQGQNVHQQGRDRDKGSLLISKHSRIGAAHIAILATAGYTEVQVLSFPQIAIISTGDELVKINEKPLPHQIRMSNSYMIEASMLKLGISAQRFHLLDTEAVILKKLEMIMQEFPVLIISGGVSKGKYDFIPEALEKLGVKKLFHRVKQRPGKPFWFGKRGAVNTVFALPGNPVSSFMCSMRYVIPFLRKCLHQHPDYSQQVVLAEDYTFAPTLMYMLQVKIENTSGGFNIAHPHTGNGSGDFANLLLADGFLELPADRSQFEKGFCLPFWPW